MRFIVLEGESTEHKKFDSRIAIVIAKSSVIGGSFVSEVDAGWQRGVVSIPFVIGEDGLQDSARCFVLNRVQDGLRDVLSFELS